MIRVIDMQPEHVNEVLEIERSSFPLPWDRDTFLFEILINKLAEYVVAVQDEKIVGYGGMWIVADEGHVTNIAVHPDHRLRGVGRAILAELIRRARSKGLTRMILEVRPSNAVARHLYRSLGFVEKGVRKRYYQDNDEDAIIMSLENLQVVSDEER
ncbi:ribosomal protein S18-alanine N-acetyltransferase [Desulfothermobacter acidiphilus]|uniref:ribosomal protein S18-alanine N-acetyltransferase n=1 Tax=Desulfothermobacter acidiphilus TaxID=1938353 RepID=UPI003F888B12